MLQLVKKSRKTISLKDHYERKNRILIKRRCGGFGDILMIRMIFEDIKTQFPDFSIDFACPQPYFNICQAHPYVNNIDLNEVNEKNYGIIYDISTACRVHENKFGKFNILHRSDIWANYCGIKLKNHEMYLTSNILPIKSDKPIILFTPFSNNDSFGIAKSLTFQQIKEITIKLQNLGYLIITTHNERKIIFDELGVQQFVNIKINDWLSLVNSCNYVISVDSATFHIAGGLRKPLVGIFSFTNGKVYGKYYDFILVQLDLDCGPCFSVNQCHKSSLAQKPCLTDLSSSQVVQALIEASKRWPFSENSPEKTGKIPSVLSA